MGRCCRGCGWTALAGFGLRKVCAHSYQASGLPLVLGLSLFCWSCLGSRLGSNLCFAWWPPVAWDGWRSLSAQKQSLHHDLSSFWGVFPRTVCRLGACFEPSTKTGRGLHLQEAYCRLSCSKFPCHLLTDRELGDFKKSLQKMSHSVHKLEK